MRYAGWVASGEAKSVDGVDDAADRYLVFVQVADQDRGSARALLGQDIEPGTIDAEGRPARFEACRLVLLAVSLERADDDQPTPGDLEAVLNEEPPPVPHPVIVAFPDLVVAKTVSGLRSLTYPFRS